MKKAFTLAEVLITLGIIGIVAAMTLPAIITKYKRKSAETKLAKFYSVMNQGIQMSIAEHGEIQYDTSKRANANNAEYIENWYKENLTKYIKTIHYEGADKNPMYFTAAFIDGTGFNSYMSGGDGYWDTPMWIFYCLNYKKCINGNYDGENQFLFKYNPQKRMIVPDYSERTVSQMKSSCYNHNPANRHGCSALIEANGWKIPDDYPWIK